MRTLKTRSWLWVTTAAATVLSLSLFFTLLPACGEEKGQSPEDANTLMTEEDLPEVTISESAAMTVALTGLDQNIYKATSAIYGWIEYDGENIVAYEVTVNGGDHLFLRYVNAQTGELMVEMDQLHEIPNFSANDADERAAYYTTCPSGWPLCIKNPSQIYFYSQNDHSWKDRRMNGGGASTTIGSVGCLLTSYAMALRYNNHGTFNPYDLDIKADTGDCYTLSNGKKSEYGDYLDGSCITTTMGGSHTFIGANEVWNQVAKGNPVIVHGQSNCLGNTKHAQMIWGHDGSRYWTKDPYYQWDNQDQAMCVSSPTYRVIDKKN